MTGLLAVDELADRILAITRTVLDAQGLGADDDLADHGGTSLSLVRIIAMIHQTLDVDVDPRDLGGRFTARRMAVAAQHVPPAAERP